MIEFWKHCPCRCEPACHKRHGGPFDRGSADAWYGRPKSPHYFVRGTYDSPCVTEPEMTAAEIADYHAGYNQQNGRKEWGDWDEPERNDEPEDDDA